MHADECMDNQVCKLFAFTSRTVTQGMLAIPQEEQIKNIK